MGNERLRSAMARRQRSTDEIAARLLVDRKTVERWLSGRTPHSRHREALARDLDVRATYLWPDHRPTEHEAGPDRGRRDVVAIYENRANVPDDLWRDLADSAQEHVDVLVYAGLFLPELDPGLVSGLKTKAQEGCTVRIALGDPDCPAVQLRGQEEGIDDGMSARVRMAQLHYRPLQSTPGVSLRHHRTTLYNSIYRFDDDMLVNTHAWGSQAFASPVLHLRRADAAGLFETYAASFDAVWATTAATPDSKRQ